MPRTELERADEAEVVNCRDGGEGEEVVRRSGSVDLREPVLPALFGGLERDDLPFGLLLRRALRVELDHGAGGEERTDLGRADLNRFLHDEVHVFPLRDSLGTVSYTHLTLP